MVEVLNVAQLIPSWNPWGMGQGDWREVGK